MRRKPLSNGFTLLELLTAISIFSLMSLLAYALMDGVTRFQKAGMEITQNIEAYQKTMQWLHRDITHMVFHISESNFHAGVGVLDSDSGGMIMLSGGLPNPNMALKRSHLFKVGYRVKKNNLERLTWSLDALNRQSAETQKPQIDVLLTDVEQLHLRFYQDRQWIHEWNSKNVSAVHLQIKRKQKGTVERIFLLTGYGLLKS